MISLFFFGWMSQVIGLPLEPLDGPSSVDRGWEFSFFLRHDLRLSAAVLFGLKGLCKEVYLSTKWFDPVWSEEICSCIHLRCVHRSCLGVFALFFLHPMRAFYFLIFGWKNGKSESRMEISMVVEHLTNLFFVEEFVCVWIFCVLIVLILWWRGWVGSRGRTLRPNLYI